MPANVPSGDWGLPPEDVVVAQNELVTQLDARVPGKLLDRNLLVASWNIRELGGLTEAWTSGPSVSPRRNVADVWAIAEILSRFDVIAIQEVQDELRALRLVAQSLGSDWGFLVTDVTRGRAAGSERLAFLYDTRRARPSGLAGELVLAPEDLADLRIGTQFARTPYLVSFATAGRPLTLATVHVIWGSDRSRRADEADALARLLALTVHDPSPRTPDDFRSNLVALGDFNISSVGDAAFRALVDGGLMPDPELQDLPRTVGDRPGRTTVYDQFAWFTRGPGILRFDRVSAGTVVWDEILDLRADGHDPTFRISDHYPLWVEFRLSPD